MLFMEYVVSCVRLWEDAEVFIALQRHAESITVSP